MTSKGEIPASGERPASLFKKKKAVGFKKKIKARLRDRSELSDDDYEEHRKSENSKEEEESTMEAIMYTKKKRRLLGSRGAHRGLDASKLMQQPHSSSSTTRLVEGVGTGEAGDSEAIANKDLTERLRGTFSEGTGADAGDGSGGHGVIRRKHKDAMEEFIHQHMAEAASSQKDTAAAPPPGKSEETTLQPKDMEAQLFAELASSAEKLSGTTKNEAVTTQTQVQEGDVGAGGAMLGGTGIAEVALPVEERIEVVRATEAAALARQQRAARPKQQQEPVHDDDDVVVSPDQMLPMNFSAGLGKRRRKQHDDMAVVTKRPVSESLTTSAQNKSGDAPITASSAGMDVLNSDVSGLGSSYSHNFRLHTHEWVTRKKEEREAELEIERQQHEKEQGPIANRERIGFEAARRAARGEPPAGESAGPSSAPLGRDGRARADDRGRDFQQRSSDDRVMRSFMSRQREQRR